MKIEINLLKCQDEEEFEKALKLYKTLKYSTGKKNIKREKKIGLKIGLKKIKKDILKV